MSETLIDERAVSGHTTRRLETRRKLLAAGTELFAECGLKDTTSTEIARRAGVATGTFYLHFADKHALFEELVEEALVEIRAQFHPDRVAPRTVRRRLDQISGMLEVVERRRDLVRAVFDQGETSGVAERIQDRLAIGLEADYRTLFADHGSSLHPGAAAQARAAAMVRVIAWWADDPTRASRSEVAALLLELDPLRIVGALADDTRPSTDPTNHLP